MERFPIEIVDDIECPKSLPVVEGVAHEIDRPHGIGHARDVQRDTLTLGQATLGRSSVIQAHRCVHAIDPFVVPVIAATTDDLVALPESPAGPVGDQLRQHCNDLGIPDRPVIGLVVIGRPRELCTPISRGDR